MAEKEGFEPSIRYKTYTPLAGERLQPLGHFSVYFAHTCYEQVAIQPFRSEWTACHRL